MKNINHYLKNAGHNSLKEVQQATISALQEHSNIVVYSKTGSGKTLAFLLGMLQSIDTRKSGIKGLILCPSRELSLQIESVFKSLKTGLKATICYGGHSIKTETNSLSETPDIVIGTPGRIADHIERGNLEELQFCQFLAIDEFDKCLEFGFNDDMEYILSQTKQLSNRLLISATRLEAIPHYVHMDKHETVDMIVDDDEILITEHIIQYKGDIVEELTRLLASFNNERSIVFCNYREVTEDLSAQLKNNGITATSYHGGLEQDARERSLIKFRNGSTNILICTDLGSRGLDIPEVMHIVHYQYPGSESAFTHRQGRTARMSSSGNSYLFEGKETQFPEYITPPSNILKLETFYPTPVPEWKTVYFSAGKKDKINKIDFVGFLYKKGNLSKNDIGLITVLDHSSYIAIRSSKVQKLLKRIRQEKVKGKKLKMAISK